MAKGWKINYLKAFKFYHESLKMDHDEPIYGESLDRIGWCISAAYGTERDIHESIRYFRLAYEAGSVRGATGLCTTKTGSAQRRIGMEHHDTKGGSMR